jgi:hypothetical protein
MSRGVAVLALILFLSTRVPGQDSKEEREAARQAEKEYEKKVDEAIKTFKKEYKGTGAQKADAVAKLAGLVHDKIFTEISPCLKDEDLVKKKALEVLSGMDHPTSANLVASCVADALRSKEMIEAVLKAADKLMWDQIYSELANKLLDKCFDSQLSGTTYQFLGTLERKGPVSCVEGLIKLLKKLEDNAKTGGGNPQYMEQAKKAMKSCSGEDKPNSKDYEVWWKANKEAALRAARVVHWCKATGKRWDRRYDDAKAYCPHHGDKKLASKDPIVIAFLTLK